MTGVSGLVESSRAGRSPAEADRQPPAGAHGGRASTPWRDRLVLAAVHGLALGALLFAAWQSREPVSNIDSVSYLSIARQYADGNFASAVNAYWSPMVSWLTAALLVVGFPDVLAFLLVNVLGAMCGIAVGTVVVRRRTGRLWPAVMYGTVGTVFFVSVSYALTPDVLVAAWAVLFVIALSHLTDAIERADARAIKFGALGLGALCALGYFTKAYLVPVAIVSFLIWAVIVVALPRRDDTGPTTRQMARIVGIVGLSALVLSGPWIGALTVKYGHLTGGSSFVVNTEAKLEPNGGTSAAPGEAMVLWAPPNDDAVSFGEDRTAQSSDRPFASETSTAERLRYYVIQRIEAFPYYLQRIGSFAPFALTSTVLLVLGLVVAGRVPERLRFAAVAAIVWMVYFVGYAAITTAASGGGNTRYYWPLLTMWALGVAVGAPVAWEWVRERARPARAVVVALLFLVPLSVLWQFGLGRSAPFSISPGPRGVAAALRTAPPTQAQHLATGQLHGVIEPGARIVGSNYRESVFIAFEMGLQAYGRANQGYDVDDAVFRDLLREHEIDFYLYFHPATAGQGPPAGLALVGPTVAIATADVGCSDLKAAAPETCEIHVVAVDR